MDSINCDLCQPGFVIDTFTLRCRPQCSSTQQFDWATYKCRPCASGQYLNSTTSVCQACPNGCGTCNYNFTSKTVQCINCVNGSVMDEGRRQCRANCSTLDASNGSWNYDWTLRQCVQCSEGQFFNQTTS